ncbi:MarR family transcriptional regulator [Cohnella luojiensis]|uniref:MarR family transcriptional regulator n=1 Tax=Cohnella luojiensis TaxID=652876 RepID=A0A4Y8LXT1_9BACL|nr:MarR family transcriptional regulator [Cohnella luojiensis]
MEKWSPFEQPLQSVSVFLTLYKTNHHLVQQLEEQLGKFDLTLGRWCVLVALKSSGRAMVPSELSDDLAVTRANISNLLNSLEQAGRIRRSFDPTNRRRILVDLTPEGHEIILNVWPVYEQTIAQNVGNKLTLEEQKQLETLLKKLV